MSGVGVYPDFKFPAGAFSGDSRPRVAVSGAIAECPEGTNFHFTGISPAIFRDGNHEDYPCVEGAQSKDELYTQLLLFRAVVAL
jgi:hypothetical protein